MKRILVGVLLLTSCAATAVDDGITMSAQERAYIQQFIMRQSDRIEQLEKALRTEKERTACA